MSIPTIAFYGARANIGTTSLVYHLAWRLDDMGLRVLAVDLDPQARLTRAFVSETRLEQCLFDSSDSYSVFDALRPLRERAGDVGDAHVEDISSGLGLVVGDMALSTFEHSLSTAWPKCSDGDDHALRITSAFWSLIQAAAGRQEADVILVDIAANLGAISRAALVASDHVVIPLASDMFSLQGIRNIGPALRVWRETWSQRIGEAPAGLSLPSGGMEPIGYVVVRHSISLNRPAEARERWIGRIPAAYATSVLSAEEPDDRNLTIYRDPNCVGQLNHYRSLMPMAREARKPMFHLKPADGAMGSIMSAVVQTGRDFRAVAEEIAKRAGLPGLE